MSQVTLEGNASGTGIFTVAAPNSNTNRTLTLPDETGTVVTTDATQTLTNKTIQNSPIQGGAITSGTAVASTSGTSIDFTGIPSWVKRITVMFSDVSTNGTSNWLVQLGDAGGVENTGYASYSSLAGVSAIASGASYTAGFGLALANAAVVAHGQCSIALLSGNVWTIGGMLARSDAANGVFICGSKTLPDTLTQVRITTVNGTDTFDAGSINILYEG